MIINILHLCHGRHVENILPVVLLGEVDVVEEEGEVLEHPLGEVHVDGGAHQEAHVEHRLAHLGWKKEKLKIASKFCQLQTAPRHSTSQQCCVYFSGHFS